MWTMLVGLFLQRGRLMLAGISRSWGAQERSQPVTKWCILCSPQLQESA